MKITNYLKTFLALSIITATFFNCSEEDDSTPEPVNEEELITTVTVTLKPETGDAITLKYQDLDGDEGPKEPEVTISGSFKPETTYSGSVVLLNESEKPVENITEEVEEEGDEHQFFFDAGSLASFTYSDKDDNDKPIGIDFSMTTDAAGTGKFSVKLRHEPNKTAPGVSDGDIKNAGGSTDVDVSFDITVE